MKLHRAATASQVAGVKPVTLRQWHLRGIIKPEADDLPEIFELATDEAVVRALRLKPNITPEVMEAVRKVQNSRRMGWRLYTDADIVRLTILVRLLNHGIDPGRAGLIAQHCEVGQKLPNPRKVYVTADGKEIKPQQQTAPSGKDRFVIVFEVNDGYKNKTGLENAESWWVERSMFHFYGAENIPAQIEHAHSSIFSHFDPDTCILLNLSAIERQVEAKLQATEEAH